MNRTLIVARILPGAEEQVASIFAASDDTELPERLGVVHRSLYSRDDLYIHLLESQQESAVALRHAQSEPEFHRISAALRPFISPYDPATWRSPADALAKEFYRYDSDVRNSQRAGQH